MYYSDNGTSASGGSYYQTTISTNTTASSYFDGGSITTHFRFEDYYPPPVEMSEAEKREPEEENRLREEAKVRSEELLLAYIGKEGFEEYKKTGSVSLKSPSNPAKTYRVNAFGGIKIYEDGKVIDILCVQLLNGYKKDSHWLPEADVVLGKIFLLENDEARLLSVANHDNRI